MERESGLNTWIIMKFVSILLCLALASVAQSATISKPRLNPINSQNETTPKPIQKLPEERRRLPIFPRSSRKFIVTPLVYRKFVTQSPIMLTKKPLMKKMVLQDKRPNLIKVVRTSKRLVMNTKFLSPKPMNIIKKSVLEVKTKRNLDFIDEPAEVGYMTRNNNFYDGDYNVRGDYSEDIAAIIYPKNENNQINLLTPTRVNENSALKIGGFIFTPKVKPSEATSQDRVLNIEDFIFTPKVKPVEVNTDNSTINSNWSERDKNISPEEMADRNEFIFLNEKNKENIISNVPDEVIPTTEVLLPPEPRVKRSINVIEEEENPGTTMSGFKLNIRDTNLSNDLSFKNINS